jgi:hypothetical protein
MKSAKIVLIISLLFNLLLSIAAIYLFVFGSDIIRFNCCPQEKICQQEEKEYPFVDDYNKEQVDTDNFENEDVPEESECNFESFEYSYVASPVLYEPDSSRYSGYMVCEEELSSCTVYGVDSSFGGSPSTDAEYRIAFDEFECSGAAAGTKYCIVEGPVLIEIVPYVR